MFRITFFTALAIGSLVRSDLPAATSSLIYEVDGKLEYTPYDNNGQEGENRGNVVPDYSRAGYKGGGVPIPFVEAKITVSPSGGDDTAAIQAAIDAVGDMPMDENGFRGAVLLEPGTFTTTDTLLLIDDGVVLRGSGNRLTGGTKVIVDVAGGVHAVAMGQGSGFTAVEGTNMVGTDYIPVGSKSIKVEDGSIFRAGDEINIYYAFNNQWITDIDTIANWSAPYDTSIRHFVTKVEGNELFLHSGLFQQYDPYYAYTENGGTGCYVSRVEHESVTRRIGVENIYFESTFEGPEDNDHARFTAVAWAARDFWIRQITSRFFQSRTAQISGRSIFGTVEDCASYDIVTGDRTSSAAVAIDDAQNILVHRIWGKDNIRFIQTGSFTPGPLAFVDCLGEDNAAATGPHHRWAIGQIYDNIKTNRVDVRDRGQGGASSGHGWTGAQIMLWNNHATNRSSPNFGQMIEAPVSAMSWSIGNFAKIRVKEDHPQGFVEFNSSAQGSPTFVTPRSLYYTQLRDRLGWDAMQNVIVPEQLEGGIWDELSSWSGNGLFGSPLVAWNRESPYSELFKVKAVVRELRMLDNGITVTWSKLTGPGNVTFQDANALETTVGFSLTGNYTLNVQVMDGSTTRNATLDVTVDSVQTNYPPYFVEDSFDAPKGNTDVAYVGTVADWAKDLEGDALTFGKVDGPAWLTVNSDGTLTGTPTLADAGIHDVTVEVTDSEGGANTANISISILSPGGSGTILREIWTGFQAGRNAITDLTSDPDFPDNPNATIELTELTYNTVGDRYGAKTAGYLHIRESGTYEFWLSADDRAELWLGTHDDPATKRKIAEDLGDPERNRLELLAGDILYIEVLHRENRANDNVYVHWSGPDFDKTIIDGAYLSPWVPAPGNNAPAFLTNPLSSTAANVLDSYSGSIVDGATDPDGDTVFYYKKDGPDWLIVNADGTLGGIPTKSDEGENTFTIITGDRKGGSDEATLTITVIDLNIPPVFTNDPFSASNAPDNTPYSDTIAGSATDADNNVLTYSKLNGPEWLIVNADGTLGGTPATSDLGTGSFTVQVFDGKTGYDEATLTIRVVDTNDPPQFYSDPFSATNGVAGAAYSDSITDAAFDPDAGDTLVAWRKIGGVDWLVVATDGTLSGTPLTENIGLNSFTIETEDANGLTQTATLNIQVEGSILREWWRGFWGGYISNLTDHEDYPDNPSGSNQLTSLEIPFDWADNYGTRVRGYVHPPVTGSYTFWVAGNNNAELWLSTDEDPANATRIAYTPSGTNNWDNAPEQQSVSFDLTAGQKYYIELLHVTANGFAESASAAWSGPGIERTVISNAYLSPWEYPGGAPTNYKPTFIDVSPFSGPDAVQDAPYSYTLTRHVVDTDGDVLTYIKTGGPAWLSVATDGTLGGTPLAGDLGSNSFTIQVSDGNGGMDTATITIEVEAEPDLSLHWKFDDGSGTTATDSSGNGTNGTINGASWVDGIDGGALSFDGSNDTVNKNISEKAWQQYTVSLWVKSNVETQVQYAGVFNNNSDATGFKIDVINGNNYRYQASDSFEIGPMGLDWAHLVVSCDGISTRIYRNGVFAGATSDLGNTFSRIQLGVDRNGSPYFDGLIDDLRVYDVAFGDQQVAELYASYPGAPVNDPPAFNADPINVSIATQNIAYSDTIEDSATDPESDPLTYSKISRDSGSGTDWLTIAPDGTLSGTPSASEAGAHSWTVQVSDGEYTDTATLNISVFTVVQEVLIDYADRPGSSGSLRDGDMGSGGTTIWYVISDDNGNADTYINGPVAGYNGSMIFSQDTGYVITGTETGFNLEFNWRDGGGWNSNMHMIAELYYTDDNLIGGTPSVVLTLDVVETTNNTWELAAVTDALDSSTTDGVGKHLFMRFLSSSNASKNKYAQIDDVYLAITTLSLNPPADPVQIFRQDYGLAEDGSEDMVDRSGNGLANIAYFLFGLDDPSKYDVPRLIYGTDAAPGLPVLRTEDDGSFTFTYVRHKTQTEYDYVVMTSSDLTDWGDVELVETPYRPTDITTEDLDEDYEFCHLGFAIQEGARFIRIRIQPSEN